MARFIEIFVYVISLLITMGIMTTNGFKKSEVISMIKDMGGEGCDVTPTNEDLDAIVTHNTNPSKNAKCFRYCLMNETKVMNPENQLDIEVCQNYFGMAFENGEELGGQVATSCNSKVHDPDRCDRAHALSMCILEELKAKDIKIEELED